MMEWEVVGSLGNPHHKYAELLALIASGKLDPSRLVTLEISLSAGKTKESRWSGEGVQKMQKRKFGNGGPEVSAIGLGCMGMSFSYGPSKDEQEIMKLLRATVERGVTFFNIAKVYGPSTNEELLCEALSPLREQVGIATKFGFNTAVDPGRIEGASALNSLPEHI